MKKKNFGGLDKIIPWRRLEDKDREKVMQNLASHEDWKSCFSEVAPGLLLFARQWVQSAADAEDIVQEAFIKFWRCVPSLSILSVATAAAPGVRPPRLAKPMNLSSPSLNVGSTRSEFWT